MSQMYFDVFPFDDMNGTSLGELTEASDKTIKDVHNGVGNGQFTINRHSSQAAWCATDNLIRVRREAGGPFAYDDSRYIFAFVIEEGAETLLSTDEEGGETATLGGRTPAVLLRRAIIYPYSSHPDNTIYWIRALKDGVVRFNAANFAEGGRSAGSVLRTFIRDAESRSPNPLDPLDDDFSYGLDSNGDSWVETDTDWEFPVGDDYLQVLEKLVSSGLYHSVTPDLILHAYEESQGVDRTATVDFTQGDNIREIADRTVHASPAVSRVIVKGTKDTSDLKFREVINATVETALGRREGYTEYTATPTNARLDLAGNKFIDKLANQHDGPTSLGALDTAGREAFVDYFPGDIVTVDIPGVWDEREVAIAAISLIETEGGEYDPVLDFLEQPWDGQDTDSVGENDDTPPGGGGNCRDCPPLEPYEPPGPPGPDIPVPCGDGTPGMAAQSFYPLGNGSGGNAAATPSPGIVHYFRAGLSEPTCPTTSGINAWHFPTYGAGGPGTTDVAGRNSGNELHLRIEGPGTFTVDANGTGDTAITWALIHVVGAVATTDDSGSGVPSSVVVPDDGVCCHRLEIRVGAGTSGGFQFRGGTWTPDTTPAPVDPYTPPIPGQQGNEQIPGTTASTTYTTNFPYVPGTLRVTVDGLSVVPDETDPDAGEFELLVDATGKTVVVSYVIASATGTGATNDPPDPDAPTSGASSLTVEEDDASPSVGSVDTLQFDADDFVVTNVGGGTVKVALGVAGFETYDGGGNPLVFDHGAMGAAETVDAVDGNHHIGELDVACTVTVAAFNPGSIVLVVTQDAGGGNGITWSGVDFGGADDQPDLTGLATTVYTFLSSGGTVLGFKAGAGTTIDPATTVEDETTWGITPAVGTDLEYARQDHTHGTPEEPEAGSVTDHFHIVDEQFSGDASTTVFNLANEAVADSVMAYVAGTRTPVTLSSNPADRITFGAAPGSGTLNISVDYAAISN